MTYNSEGARALRAALRGQPVVWTAQDGWTDNEPSHVEYPHEPGRLPDCKACELGPCTCDATTAPCVSVHCTELAEG